MQNERKNLIIVLIGYVLLLLIDGIIRNHMISKILPESYQPISNVINGFSLFFSTIWMVIIIMLSIIFTFLFTALFNDTFDYNKLLKAWSDLVIIDIIIGIGKFSLLWILLEDELEHLSINDSTIKNLSNLSYTITCSKMDLITIYISNIVFAVSLYLSSKKDIIFSITISLFLLGMMLSLYFKII